MEGLRYQLKSVLRDKFCLMTFLLPIVVAAALNFAGRIDLSSLGELHFGILKNGLPAQTVTWLERYGSVMAYATQEELVSAINEPSTNLIGVTAEGTGIKTIVSGDELDIFRQTAGLLPDLYEKRDMTSRIKVEVLERPDVMAGYQDIFIAAILIIAMFMGCTFNAMNMISEKEDGVTFVNEILPMTYSGYMLQKLIVGFLCGCLSSIATACICFRLSFAKCCFLLILIVLSAFVAALIGILVGRISDGLMVGMAYIKMVMLLFIAVPVVSFLAGNNNPFLSALCYLVPSQATFEGIMGLSIGGQIMVAKDVLILLMHCMVWFGLYLFLSKWKRKK